MIHPLSYNILSFHCPNYKQMGKWQVLFYGVVKRTVSSEFKFSLLKKPWPVPGLGICNKQSYFSCPVTVSMPWGCVPGTHPLWVLSSWMWLSLSPLRCCYAADEKQTAESCTWKISMAEPQHLTSPFTFGLPKCRRAERFHWLVLLPYHRRQI